MRSSPVLIACVIILAIVLALLAVNQYLAYYDRSILKRDIVKHRKRQVPLLQSGVGEECAYTACSNDLVCDRDTLSCRLGGGSKCFHSTECQKGYYCSGICTNSAYNEMYKQCPCASPLKCILDATSGLSRCLKMDGQTCSGGSECAGGACVNKTCYSKFPNGRACNQDGDCGSSNCSRSVCQAQGVVAHTLGSSCNLGVSNDVSFCNAGLSCYPRGEGGTLGVCLSSPLSLGDSCTSDGANCSTSLACVSNSTFSECTDKTTKTPSNKCMCRLPFPDSRVSNKSRACAGLTEWSVAGRCLSINGSPCVSTGDCLEGTCMGNPVIVRYTLETDGHGNKSVVSAVDSYAPSLVHVVKLRTLETPMTSSSSSTTYIIHGKDKSIRYSVGISNYPSASTGYASSSESSGAGLQGAHTWRKLETVGDGHILDFDCDAQGVIYALADLEPMYGNQYRTCILVASTPSAEANIVHHVGSNCTRLCVHSSSRNVYILDTDGVTVYVLRPPLYATAQPVNIDLPKGVQIVDILAATMEGSERLMGLSRGGFLMVRLKATGYMYPSGVFGDRWKAKVLGFSGRSRGDGTGVDLNLISRCQVESEEGKFDILALESSGETWLLPGPGGLKAPRRDVIFDCAVNMSARGIARVWFGRSCIPK